MKHIQTLIDKEWAEIFKNRMVSSLFVLMPLLFTALPLVMLATTGNDMAGLDPSLSGLPATVQCGAMGPSDCIKAYMMNQFMLFFLMLPMMLPAVIAAYSIVGEKTTRSLEPLLATPISTLELLLGKALSALIPSVAVTWLGFGLFLVGVRIIGVSAPLWASITSPAWLLAIAVLGPIVALISVIFAIYISSRVNDPRVAEQLSGLLVVPFMGIFFLQMMGKVQFTAANVLITIFFLGSAAVLLFWFGIRIFDRENILTKWK